MSQRRALRQNAIGLTQADYKGLPTSLCQGCGHNSISSQIVRVAFELNIQPNEIVRLSGIGCSSWVVLMDSTPSMAACLRSEPGP